MAGSANKLDASVIGLLVGLEDDLNANPVPVTRVRVLDVSGKLMVELPAPAMTSKDQVNLKQFNLPAGVYFIISDMADGSIQHRKVLQL